MLSVYEAKKGREEEGLRIGKECGKKNSKKFSSGELR